MGIKFFKIAVVYLLIGVSIGYIMGMTHNFSFTSVHAHVNLLGWASMALFGLIYHFYPQAGETKLAKVHFWLHNIGTPFLTAGVFLIVYLENEALTVLPIIGSNLVLIGIILFLINVFRHVKAENLR
ncbi:cytochrome-c oxidase [Metabacillus sediminilitoris]|uniref:Cytochrome-c oxidase n=1 Tax=Metabacillus sediminilitoris TaxID=2567941 RepID=A0A4S4BL82_9BACI|nr:cytochrome-c oxidase [Metabacillus sediminilitoris]QGQ44055.1 cytochrome-c oxidase [Metabacillus sediminilitoris]THF75431.1 cytochrome-c oxidase [Metabacillus sediminilitoris]